MKLYPGASPFKCWTPLYETFLPQIHAKGTKVSLMQENVSKCPDGRPLNVIMSAYSFWRHLFFFVLILNHVTKFLPHFFICSDHFPSTKEENSFKKRLKYGCSVRGTSLPITKGIRKMVKLSVSVYVLSLNGMERKKWTSLL